MPVPPAFAALDRSGDLADATDRPADAQGAVGALKKEGGNSLALTVSVYGEGEIRERALGHLFARVDPVLDRANAGEEEDGSALRASRGKLNQVPDPVDVGLKRGQGKVEVDLPLIVCEASQYGLLREAGYHGRIYILTDDVVYALQHLAI